MSIEVKIEINCAKCGESLDEQFSETSKYGDKISISVKPCKNCGG